MKSLLTLILFFCSVLLSAQDLVTVRLSGKITNPKSDTILITNGWSEQFHLAPLNKDGSFKTEFRLESGYYRINDMNETTTVYFGKDYDLYLTLNTDSFDESILYSGNGADANNYLAKKALIKESRGKLDYYGYYCMLEEPQFLELTDSLTQVGLSNLKNTTISDEVFRYREFNSLTLEKIYRLNIYPGTYKYLTKNKNYIESSIFPKPFNDFNPNDEGLIEAPMYLSTISDYLYKVRDTAAYRKMNDYTQYIIESMQNNILNQNVKIRAMHYFCMTRLTKAKDLDTCFAIYKSIETDPKRLKLIEDKYLARKKTQKGAISPPFSYEDDKGETITHKDLKGKLVYIDLWATWCGPCLREIPYFDTLQEAFEGKNITFVSICQNDTKERWKQAIEVKNLKGLQLYADGDGSQFYEDYQVAGIPRYIILDKEGKIIDSDAKRPSDKRLVEELQELLK